jgi:hypothetical protein
VDPLLTSDDQVRTDGTVTHGEGRSQPPRLPWHQALLGAVQRRSLYRTVPAALIVGTTLFMVNLYSTVRAGPFAWHLAGQITLTFLVPWLNATMGIAIGLRSGAPTVKSDYTTVSTE